MQMPKKVKKIWDTVTTVLVVLVEFAGQRFSHPQRVARALRQRNA